MTPEAIRTEILASATLRAMIEYGQDADAAQYLTETQPGTLKPLRISELGLIALYANPIDAETVLQTIEAVAEQNPIIRRVHRFMQPGVPESSLPDFSLPSVRMALKAPTNMGGLGLSDALAQPILDAMEIDDVVTASEVSAAVAAWRPDGKTGPIPGDAT